MLVLCVAPGHIFYYRRYESIKAALHSTSIKEHYGLCLILQKFSIWNVSLFCCEETLKVHSTFCLYYLIYTQSILGCASGMWGIYGQMGDSTQREGSEVGTDLTADDKPMAP